MCSFRKRSVIAVRFLRLTVETAIPVTVMVTAGAILTQTGGYFTSNACIVFTSKPSSSCVSIPISEILDLLPCCYAFSLLRTINVQYRIKSDFQDSQNPSLGMVVGGLNISDKESMSAAMGLRGVVPTIMLSPSTPSFHVQVSPWIEQGENR